MGSNRYQIVFVLFCLVICGFVTLLSRNNQVLDEAVTPQRCQGEERRLCVPPLRNFEKRFRTSSKYKINICAIEKNFSTILTAIACFLFNETRYREKGRSFNEEEFGRRTCKTSNEVLDIAKLESKFNVSLDDWVYIAPVREPVDRFISGFVDKCLIEKVWIKKPELCNRCKTNVSCFAEAEYVRMMRFSNGAKINSFDDRHFFPQNWRCHFYEHFRRFQFIKYSSTDTESFLDQLYSIFRQQNVSENSISFITEQINSGRTKHATVTRPERVDVEKQIVANPRVLTLITRMYYYDFVLFGFPLPVTEGVNL